MLTSSRPSVVSRPTSLCLRTTFFCPKYLKRVKAELDRMKAKLTLLQHCSKEPPAGEKMEAA
jgi:hypothetical protein